MSRRSFLRSLARRFGYDLRRRSDLVQQADPFAAQAALCAGRPVKRIFDVGAHEGQTVARYGALFPTAQIHAFEPVPATFRRLESAVEGQPSVTPHPCALGDEDGTLVLHVNRAADTSSAYAFSKRATEWMPDVMTQTVETESVPVKRLDTYCAKAGVEHIDILKLDVQGFELAVLKGGVGLLARAAIDLILCEVEFVPVYEGQPLAHDVTAFLHAHGYRLFRHYELVYSPAGQLLWGDALYLSPTQVALLPDTDKTYRQCKTAD